MFICNARRPKIWWRRGGGEGGGRISSLLTSRFLKNDSPSAPEPSLTHTRKKNPNNSSSQGCSGRVITVSSSREIYTNKTCTPPLDHKNSEKGEGEVGEGVNQRRGCKQPVIKSCPFPKILTKNGRWWLAWCSFILDRGPPARISADSLSVLNNPSSQEFLEVYQDTL